MPPRTCHIVYERSGRESRSLQSWHQMPGSTGQSAHINQTDLMCFTAFSAMLAPVYMSFRPASNGHRGLPSRAGAKWVVSSPIAEGYEGDREQGVLTRRFPSTVQPLCWFMQQKLTPLSWAFINTEKVLKWWSGLCQNNSIFLWGYFARWCWGGKNPLLSRQVSSLLPLSRQYCFLIFARWYDVTLMHSWVSSCTDEYMHTQSRHHS